MQPTAQLSSIGQASEHAVTIAVMLEKLGTLTEAMEQIRNSLQHMATKEQVAQLVSRSEFEKMAWRIEQLEKQAQDNSPLAVWKNFTLVVSGLVSLIALVVAVTGWRPT